MGIILGGGFCERVDGYFFGDGVGVGVGFWYRRYRRSLVSGIMWLRVYV